MNHRIRSAAGEIARAIPHCEHVGRTHGRKGRADRRRCGKVDARIRHRAAARADRAAAVELKHQAVIQSDVIRKLERAAVIDVVVDVRVRRAVRAERRVVPQRENARVDLDAARSRQSGFRDASEAVRSRQNPRASTVLGEQWNILGTCISGKGDSPADRVRSRVRARENDAGRTSATAVVRDGTGKRQRCSSGRGVVLKGVLTVGARRSHETNRCRNDLGGGRRRGHLNGVAAICRRRQCQLIPGIGTDGERANSRRVESDTGDRPTGINHDRRC